MINWNFFPRSRECPAHLEAMVEVFRNVEKLIDSAAHTEQHSDAVLATVAPGLGDLPVLGALFRSNGFRRQETELVIVVTPYLVKPVNATAIKLPTDGYQAATDVQRFLEGQTFKGKSGEQRPVPTQGAVVPPAPTFAAMNMASQPFAASPSRVRMAAALLPVRHTGSGSASPPPSRPGSAGRGTRSSTPTCRASSRHSSCSTSDPPRSRDSRSS